jgi:hypothetical protein
VKPGENSLSDLTLERYVLGELSDGEALEVEGARARDPEVDARLKAIEASNEEILARYRPELMARGIEGRLGAEKDHPGKRVPARVWGLPLGLAAILLVAFLALPRLAGPRPSDSWRGTDLTRAKGLSTNRLLVYRKAAGGPERLAPGGEAASGDVLQLGYEIAARAYGAILSIDGRGSVTFHLPSGYSGGSARAPLLEEGGRPLLSSAFELDDAPAFERFFLVLSGEDFDLASLDKAAHALATDPGRAEAGALDLASGLEQLSFTVVKRGRR